MDIQNQTPTSICELDEITKSFQREAEALREIVRSRDLQIKALKAHSLCLTQNFKEIIGAIIEKFADDDVQFHAKKIIEQIERAETSLEKMERGQ